MSMIDETRAYIMSLKNSAKASGKKSLVLLSRDIHDALNLKERYPTVCKAMRDCMNSGDVILYAPPKGNSCTVEIEYKL